MDKNLQVALASVGKSTTSILNALANSDRYALQRELKHYKRENGAADFPALLKIPSADRIGGLIRTLGHEYIHRQIGAAITVASESINLKYPLTAGQIFEIVDQILDSCEEDYLALQDVLLFLQKLVRGEAGKVYDRLDVPKFMELFENYREQRYQALKEIRYEQNAQFKALGDTGRTSPRDELSEKFAGFAGRLSDIKDKLADQRGSEGE